MNCCRKLKCPYCEDSVDSPVKLPCRHVLCLKCVVELQQMEIFCCPEDSCQKKFPHDFKAEVMANKK